MDEDKLNHAVLIWESNPHLSVYEKLGMICPLFEMDSREAAAEEIELWKKLAESKNPMLAIRNIVLNSKKLVAEEIFKAIRKHLIDSGFGDLIDENFIEMEKKFGIRSEIKDGSDKAHGNVVGCQSHRPSEKRDAENEIRQDVGCVRTGKRKFGRRLVSVQDSWSGGV